MPPGVRNVLVPLGSVVFSFVVVAAAGAVIGGHRTAQPDGHPYAVAGAAAEAPAAPAKPADVKIVFEQADGTVAPASAAGESMTLDITTESKADGIRVCVAQPIGAWKLDGTWAHIGPREYCRSLTPAEFPVVVKLVHP